MTVCAASSPATWRLDRVPCPPRATDLPFIFPHGARAIIAAVTTAIEAANPSKVVCLSTIGAQATQPNLLNQLGLLERALGALPSPVCFLRAVWFMENAAWDVAPARDAGVVPSFLQPLDKPVPMVATADIGHLAATLLQETWTGRRIVELEGPRRITPNQIAATFAELARYLKTRSQTPALAQRVKRV
jgi:NAD(P)H dehydrogenase (quinone)